MGEGVILMQFSSFAELLHMGGHGFYVWLAFAITFFIYALLLIFPILKRRKIKRDIQQRKLFDEQVKS